MSGRACDIAIVGGGLAGGLIALALRQRRPDLSLLLIEAGTQLGGNHRWSWFASDLDAEGEKLLEPVAKTEWTDGYDVVFPGYRRQLDTPYRSMTSKDLAEALTRELPESAIMVRREVMELDRDGVTLRSGERIAAGTVIDARGFATTGHLTGGWQVFKGRHFRTDEPHGVTRPVIMDASVDQIGGYRFMYLLPLGENDIFLEDTYYQDTPMLDRETLSGRIDDYCRAQGWKGETVSFETGVLPVITGGNFAKFQARHHIDGVSVVGARGGFVHPLTSYTLPFAVQTALFIAENAGLGGEKLAEKVEKRAREHWRRTGFYRLLGSMLFGASRPQMRYRVFARFYRLPALLIERFYAARSTTADRLRILLGRPPVPLWRAARALVTSRPALLDGRNEEDQ